MKRAFEEEQKKNLRIKINLDTLEIEEAKEDVEKLDFDKIKSLYLLL